MVGFGSRLSFSFVCETDIPKLWAHMISAHMICIYLYRYIYIYIYTYIYLMYVSDWECY